MPVLMSCGQSKPEEEGRSAGLSAHATQAPAEVCSCGGVRGPACPQPLCQGPGVLGGGGRPPSFHLELFARAWRSGP